MAKEISDSNLNSTPSANRVHISFFGRRNAGKSSLVNAVTGQSLSIVSKVKGTTTDPVQKAMELLPLGPVVIIDTPGIDDEGQVGALRVEKARGILAKTDIAVLTTDSADGLKEEDFSLIKEFRRRKIPFIVAFNKADTTPGLKLPENGDFPCLMVSAKTGSGIDRLKTAIAEAAKPVKTPGPLIGDKLKKGDVVVLVTPIDDSAPKGRLILPQVQTIRDILDADAICLVSQLSAFSGCLAALKTPPALVITDSQVFGAVRDMLPEGIKLTSFSIVMARLKGILDTAAEGAYFTDRLQEGDAVLISEGCTHHRQCEDIGTVKLPRWIEAFTGKNLDFHFTSGGEFPGDLSRYALIVHCGGCMRSRREMQSRMEAAKKAGVPFTNYGTLIAHINGILDKSLEIFYE